MPGNLTPPNPVDVMPAGLCHVFNEELRYEAYANAYPDGSSERQALSLNPRHFWRCTRPLTPAQYTALLTFWRAHRIEPFYFYSLRETVPPWTWDASGAATSGRYTVVFDGSWAEQLNLTRSEVSIGLREVG